MLLSDLEVIYGWIDIFSHAYNIISPSIHLDCWTQRTVQRKVVLALMRMCYLLFWEIYLCYLRKLKKILLFLRSVLVILLEMEDNVEGNTNVVVDLVSRETEEKSQFAKPTLGKVFNDKNELTTFYSNYAREEGFAVKIRSSNMGEDGQLKYITFACSRFGKNHSFKELPSSTAINKN